MIRLGRDDGTHTEIVNGDECPGEFDAAAAVASFQEIVHYRRKMTVFGSHIRDPYHPFKVFSSRDAAFADDQFNGATALPLIRSALGTY